MIRTKEAHRSCRNLDVKASINLHKPSEDKIWQTVDEQLHDELPIEIGSSPDEQLENLENHVYKSLVKRFVVKPVTAMQTNKKQKLSPQDNKGN